MNQEIVRRHIAGGAGRSLRFRAGAAAILLAAVTVVVYLSLRTHTSSPAAPQTTEKVSAVSVTGLETLARTLGHPIFWIGTRARTHYELTRYSNGNIAIRYLRTGAPIGAKASYLTVATYPFLNPYAALAALGHQHGSTPLALPDGGIAVLSNSEPDNVHAAFPGVNFQAEIYDPIPGEAKTLAATGKLRAIGIADLSRAATVVTRAGLLSFAASVHHPIFWAGPESRMTYERRVSSTGQIYVRYLPKGVAAGAARPYLTVATYPFKGAYSAVLRLAQKKGADVIRLKNDGVAVVDQQDPRSIHLAFPKLNYQVEVFDPSSGVARRIVAANRIVGVN
jgi:hypothetical protein